jgi:HPt (histidine-containing phosphotransfer) domain-containing protein
MGIKDRIMVIDKEKFQENFKHFDKELIVEIIDLFIAEHAERMTQLKQNITDLDMVALRFNAHSFKGVIANFMAELPKSHAKSLEEKAKMNDTSGLNEIYEYLQKSTAELLDNLKEIRMIYAN